MESWDERIRSESAYLRPFRDERVCANDNTVIIYRQVCLYSLIQNLKNPTGQKNVGIFFPIYLEKKVEFGLDLPFFL